MFYSGLADTHGYTQLAANTLLWAAVPGNVLITSLEIDVKAKNKLTARWLHWICFCCWNLIVVVMVTNCSPRGWRATSWQDECTRSPAERQPVSKQSATDCWQFSLNVAISQKIAAYHLFLCSWTQSLKHNLAQPTNGRKSNVWKSI